MPIKEEKKKVKDTMKILKKKVGKKT